MSGVRVIVLFDFMSRVIAAVPAEALVAADTLSRSERAQIIAAELYEQMGPELLHFALALSREEELAKDALQEAFMRYFVALSEGAEITSPRAWIYRVMHNFLLDRMKEASYRYARDARDQQPLVHHQDIERECFRQELLRLFRTALTTREYSCLHLRTEGLRYEEIANRLNLTSGTVGALISRATRKLRRVLAPIGGRGK
ncbi:MAG TPA: sigma-70 family RNA polymerase sigma factor [Bryobacteraceae bacterium]|jgi:RNA polymerase sigma-70 factor (ECF subfamily)